MNAHPTRWIARLSLFFAMATAAPPGHAVVIHGRVIDDATGQPVENFVRRVRSYDLHRAAENWQDHLDATADPDDAGSFTWDWPRAYEQFVVRIEAEGYQPTVSRVIQRNEMEVELIFRLKAAVPTAGRVVAPDGRPVAGAQVTLATVSRGARWQDGTLTPAHERYQTFSDEAGRFRLPAEVDSFTLIAAADQGVAMLGSEDAESPFTLHLKPWGGLRGRLLDHEDKPLPNEPVDLHRGLPDTWPYISIDHDMKTDAEGRFAAERVPPGAYQIVHADRHADGGRVWLGGKIVHLEIAPDQSRPLILGGRGRPVLGVIASPDGVPQEGLEVHLTLKPPYWKHASEAQLAAYQRFVASDAGSAYSGTDMTNADGRFVVNLPPGNYWLRLAGSPILISQQVTVKPLSGYEAYVPQHLGTFRTPPAAAR
ncbi:MAG: carboxypeptidase-like regulatory domain-containing protein [Planctomycetota bacterium]